MNTTKRINRGHLLRAARKGQLWIRCRMRCTDDYAFDAATNYGQMDEFKQVKVVEDREQQVSAAADGFIPMYEHDFRYKSGHVLQINGEDVWAQLAGTTWNFEIRRAA